MLLYYIYTVLSNSRLIKKAKTISRTGTSAQQFSSFRFSIRLVPITAYINSTAADAEDLPIVVHLYPRHAFGWDLAATEVTTFSLLSSILLPPFIFLFLSCGYVTSIY